MFSFRPLTSSDFKLLHAWLNVDFVTKWYAKRKFTYDDVEKKYSAYVTHKKPTDSYLIIYQNVPIGYIQTYKIADYPEYAACVQVGDSAAGIDMFIGDKSYTGKGLGKDIMLSFLDSVVFKTVGIDRCIVGPEPSNRMAIRVYEKAGFTHIKTVTCPNADEPEYLMMKRKKDETIVYKS